MDSQVPPQDGDSPAHHGDSTQDQLKGLAKICRELIEHGGGEPDLDEFVRSVPARLRSGLVQQITVVQTGLAGQARERLERLLQLLDDDRTYSIQPITGNYRQVDPPDRPLDQTQRPERIRYFGGYELLQEIAQGGMGVVYRARQVSLNRMVAVKMIRAGQFATQAEVRRFQVEAEAAASLRHPNIVAIQEVGEHEGRHYFSMDLVEGQNLLDILRDNPMQSIPAAELVKTIACAVEYAHQHGVLHRDLKPSNVLIDSSGQPYLTDFGLATRTAEASQLTQSGTVLGTPCYMPPEQTAGRRAEIGQASDVYSLGAILFHLLTGRPPFHAETVAETLIHVINDDPVSPRKLNSAIPRDLEAICLKCLDKRPERRYAAAHGLAEDLRRFCQKEPISARRPGLIRHAWTWSRRRPWTIATFASFSVFGLLMLCFWLWQEMLYLQWTAEHPDFVRKRGVLTERLGHLGPLLGIISGLGCVAYSIFASHVGHRKYERRAVGRSLALFSGLAGLAIIAFAIYAMMYAIAVDVWESNAKAKIFVSPVFTVIGWMFLVASMRTFEYVEFGLAAGLELSQEDRQAITNLLEKRKYRAAFILYRQKMSVDQDVAAVAIAKMQADLHRVCPSKFPPAMTLMRRMKRGLLWLGTGMVVVLLLLSPRILEDISESHWENHTAATRLQVAEHLQAGRRLAAIQLLDNFLDEVRQRSRWPDSDPRVADVYDEFAHVLINAREYDLAKSHLERSLNVRDSIQTKKLLAQACDALGDEAEALRLYREILTETGVLFGRQGPEWAQAEKDVSAAQARAAAAPAVQQ